MPDVWGFQEVNHQTLLQVARERRLQPQQGARVAPLTPSRLRGWVVAKTPSGGIPKLTIGPPDVAGKAVCELYTINDDDEMEAVTDDTGAAVTETIYHIGDAEDIAGEVYIQFKVDGNGRHIADFEACPV